MKIFSHDSAYYHNILYKLVQQSILHFLHSILKRFLKYKDFIQQIVCVTWLNGHVWKDRKLRMFMYRDVPCNGIKLNRRLLNSNQVVRAMKMLSSKLKSCLVLATLCTHSQANWLLLHVACCMLFTEQMWKSFGHSAKLHSFIVHHILIKLISYLTALH